MDFGSLLSVAQKNAKTGNHSTEVRNKYIDLIENIFFSSFIVVKAPNAAKKKKNCVPTFQYVV